MIQSLHVISFHANVRAAVSKYIHTQLQRGLHEGRLARKGSMVNYQKKFPTNITQPNLWHYYNNTIFSRIVQRRRKIYKFESGGENLRRTPSLTLLLHNPHNKVLVQRRKSDRVFPPKILCKRRTAERFTT